jgi:transposase
VDGYAGCNRLLKHADRGIELAYCWAHARRKLHEIAKNSTVPIAEDGLRRIAALYRIEADIRGQTPKGAARCQAGSLLTQDHRI